MKWSIMYAYVALIDTCKWESIRKLHNETITYGLFKNAYIEKRLLNC